MEDVLTLKLVVVGDGYVGKTTFLYLVMNPKLNFNDVYNYYGCFDNQV